MTVSKARCSGWGGHGLRGRPLIPLKGQDQQAGASSREPAELHRSWPPAPDECRPGPRFWKARDTHLPGCPTVWHWVGRSSERAWPLWTPPGSCTHTLPSAGHPRLRVTPVCSHPRGRDRAAGGGVGQRLRLPIPGSHLTQEAACSNYSKSLVMCFIPLLTFRKTGRRRSRCCCCGRRRRGTTAARPLAAARVKVRCTPSGSDAAFASRGLGRAGRSRRGGHPGRPGTSAAAQSGRSGRQAERPHLLRPPRAVGAASRRGDQEELKRGAISQTEGRGRGTSDDTHHTPVRQPSRERPLALLTLSEAWAGDPRPWDSATNGEAA